MNKKTLPIDPSEIYSSKNEDRSERAWAIATVALVVFAVLYFGFHLVIAAMGLTPADLGLNNSAEVELHDPTQF
jgi:hypothetical protein